MATNESRKTENNHESSANLDTTHNPTLASILSLIPGLGQVYNKRYIKGAVIFVLFAAFVIVMYDFMTTSL